MNQKTKQLEMWAGLECTVNRVQDRYYDQCVRNGHDLRHSDYKLFKNLGISRLRYPVIWEKVVRGSNPKERDWSGSDRALKELDQLGLPIVAGLCHHGSGPRFTSLVDPNFPEHLAAYARSVIERYPHLDAFTPVNEPLTTARFSGLYGVWYPHGSDDATFLKALVNEVKGTILAMRAIREVKAAAQLIWTEDFGRAQGTETLRYQVDFENERRFLSLDLLMGKIDRTHPLYEYLTNAAHVSEDDLAWFRENAMEPDLIGMNHYPLSNRYLDERLELFPSHLHGGNGRHRYADVGAIDTDCCRTLEPLEIYRDVWNRFRIPCAVTEAHISGGREAQMRWLDRIWRGCQQLRNEGCDIRAVTAWSLLGSYDWNSLCSLEQGFYESGVFDVRTGTPRPTQIAKMVHSFATHGRSTHPVLNLDPILVVSSTPQLRNTLEQAGIERRLAMRFLSIESKWDSLPDDLTPWAVILEGVEAELAEPFLQFLRMAQKRNLALLVISLNESPSTFSDENTTRLEQTCTEEFDEFLAVRCEPQPRREVIDCCLDFLIDGESGIYELRNEKVLKLSGSELTARQTNLPNPDFREKELQ